MSASHRELLSMLKNRGEKKPASMENALTLPTKAPFVSNVSSNPVENKKKLTDSEIVTINHWLNSIGEDNPETRVGVIQQCKTDPAIRQRFLDRAAAVPVPDNVVPICPEIELADCPTCRHQQRSSVNPEGGLTFCAIRKVAPMLPHCKRPCAQWEAIE